MKLDTLFASLVPAVAIGVSSVVMQAAREKVAEQNKNKLVEETVKNITKLESAFDAEKQTVREYRQCFETRLKKLKKLDTAMKYANETGNFFPAMYIACGLHSVHDVARRLGYETPSEKDDVLQVPKGWTPTVVVAPEVATA